MSKLPLGEWAHSRFAERFLPPQTFAAGTLPGNQVAFRGVRLHAYTALILWVALSTAGCSLVPKSQLDAAQGTIRTLQTSTEAATAELQNVKVRAQQAEDELNVALKELKQLESEVVDSRKALSQEEWERHKLRAQLVEHIPAGRRKPGGESPLADLALRTPWLKYDATTGIAKVTQDIHFTSGQATVGEEGIAPLEAIARLLKSPLGEELYVLAVGHTDDQPLNTGTPGSPYKDSWQLSTARAQAVADQLRAQGIKAQRLGISGFSHNQPIAPNDTAAGRAQNRRCEIYLMDPDTPVIGRGDTLPELYE